MWLARRNSTSTRPHHRKFSSSFSCSSFKDIQKLCAADSETPPASTSSSSSFIKSPSIFHRVRLASSVLRAFAWASLPASLPQLKPTHEESDAHLSPESVDPPTGANAPPEQFEAEPEPLLISLPGAENHIVVYYTSLRVVRSTFEDCNTVRSILRGFRVSIDERDLAMDSGFMDELRRILGQPEKTKLPLPRVFIGGRYMGGAEEIKQLHEAGELKKFVEGLPPADGHCCELCGGYRFILCEECSGSHKCYSEKTGFRSCTACNENGLIWCPSCSFGPL